MVNFIYSLMTDKRNGAVYAPFKAVLYLASLAYGAAIFIRTVLYKFAIFRTRHVPMKVISVGNLTLGGTGKTPFVIALAKILEDEMKRNACIMIRGYGWDEQAMLKRNLTDTPILVGEDRVRSAHRAIKLYGSSTAILDDGFQYWELGRDLNIVLIDSRNPFGNGHLFPRGVLRETKAALKRADIVVFTKTNKSGARLAALKDEIRRIKSDIIFLEAIHEPHHLYDVKARKFYDLSYMNGKRVILVSSIGDPGYFEETVKGLGANVLEHIIFPDHHNYRKKDIERIMKRCDERKFDFVATTEKDTVKFQRLALSFAGYPLIVVAVELEIISGKEGLSARLHSLYTS